MLKVCRFSFHFLTKSSNVPAAIQQLSELSKYASELFEDLAGIASKSNDRMNALRGRLNKVSASMPTYVAAIHEKNVSSTLQTERACTRKAGVRFSLLAR